MIRRPWAQWVFNFSVLAVIVLVVAGIGWLFAKAIESGSTFLGAILAAVATVTTVLVGRHHERRKEAEATRRAELGALYEKMAGVMAGQSLTMRAQEKMVTEFVRKAIIYAGPALIAAFREWKVNIPEADDPPRAEVRANLIRFEKLIKAMRKDLGMSNWMIEEGDLLRAALLDFDEEFPQDAPPLEPPEPDEEPRVSAGATTRS
jgi:hypothetical protein